MVFGRLAKSRLIRQIAEQAAATLAVQVLGAVTTLSFVHLLPTDQYAIFGLCLSTVGFIAAASDLGLMAAMNFFWRSEVAGGEPFADRYAAIRKVRVILFGVSGTIAAIALGWLEYKQGVPGWAIAASVVLTLILAWAQILSAMILVALRLGQQLRRAYQADLAGAVVRAVLAVLAFVLALHQAWFPLASLGVASLVTLLIARSTVPEQFRSMKPPSKAAIKSTVRYILPTMPATIMFSVQDLVIVWLAWLMGGTTVVAQTFALGRLAAIFVTLNSIMANVIIPRIVNLADDSHAHRNGVISIGIIGGFCALLTAGAALVPDAVLFVLGKAYSGLATELVMSLGAASLMLLAQAFGQFNRTMGWVRWETAMMLVHLAAMIVLVWFCDFRTTQGVLTFNILFALAGLLEMVAINLIGYRAIHMRKGTTN
jgi:O-antigen/teichoic acid export membrane protein